MSALVPKSGLVCAFLKMKGWKHEKTTEKYHIFSPPSDFKFEEEFFYRIPVQETAPDYPRYIRSVVGSIADLYQISARKLTSDLAKSKNELQKDIEFKQQLLAVAS